MMLTKILDLGVSKLSVALLPVEFPMKDFVSNAFDFKSTRSIEINVLLSLI